MASWERILFTARRAVKRAGRTSDAVGAQRLISPDDCGNVARSFEALRVSLTMHAALKLAAHLLLLN